MCKRRNVAIKYDRYAAALAAAAVYNTNRGSSDDPTVSAFDFIRDEASAIKRERTREAKRHIQKTIGQMPMGTPISKLQDVRRKVISDLAKSGFTNAEALMNECWPHLKPTEEEQA